jgi:Eukaryotic aspartyl protease
LTTTDGSFNISYDSPGDTDSGYYFNDVLALTNSVTIKNMTVGLATYAFDAQGLMGMGFPAGEASVQTLGTTTPTVLDQLVQQGLINRAAFSLYMNDLNADSGSILFGGIDTSKYTGNLVSFPIQPNSQDGTLNEFTVTLSSVSVNDNSGTRLLSSPGLAVPALLDSGTTSLVLPNDIYVKILNGMGATDIGALTSPVVPCAYAKSNASLTFGFGGSSGLTVTVPFSEMIGDFYLEDSATYTDGVPQCNLDVTSQATDLTGSVILGDSFLRGAYVVYDLQNQEIAIAQANLNPGPENIVAIPSGTGLPGVSSTGLLPAATGVAVATGGAVTTAISGVVSAPATPTFNLGAVSTAKSSSNTKNGAGQLQAIGTTAFGISISLGVLTLLGALIL